MTTAQNILEFISQLKENNNREWFSQNKDWYNQVRSEFEQLVEIFILEISKFDEEIKHLTPKECLFRIYRDIRFSHDKTPYKTHLGAYIATPNGRKSPRGGYYLHLEPDASFASIGIWSPQPNVLKSLRQSIYDNLDELNDIRSEKEFAKYFKDFNQEDKLKTIPKEFPKDFPEAELLKLKHFFIDSKLDEKTLKSSDFVSEIVSIYKAGYPLNKFLNYTVDEVI